MLGEKILAVGSGKGGVGKSTTAINIALLAAKSGKRCALIDMDPLSNLGVILDIPGTELNGTRSDLDGQKLEEYLLDVFPRLSIAFPHSKTRSEYDGASRLHDLVFQRFAGEFQRRFDLLVLDLPAGILGEENLDVFPYLNSLIVVTNAEPTSHVSAGGYIKAAVELNPSLRFFIWNNKFVAGADPSFNPRDLLGNYNRYAPDELRLSEDVARNMQDVAFVPQDPALNLLYSDADFRLELLYKIREANLLIMELIVPLMEDQDISPVSRKLLRYYLLKEYKDDGEDAALDYCAAVHGKPVEQLFSVDELEKIRGYLARQRRNPLRSSFKDCLTAVDKLIDMHRGTVPALQSQIPGQHRRLNRSIVKSFLLLDRLVQKLSEESMQRRYGKIDGRMLRNSLGLAFFYYGIHRLMDHEKLRNLLLGFIPHKTVGNKRFRDRNRQIMMLLKRDHSYHKKFFYLVKTLFPMVEKQLRGLSAEYRLEAILFKDGNGRLNRNAYLKLLAELMHDMLNAGLGVHVSSRLNKAAREIQTGYRRLEKVMADAASG